MTTTTAAARRIATLKSSFAANEMTQAQVVALAKTEKLTLPSDFFASASVDKVAGEVRAPQAFAPTDGASATGGARQAELRMQAAKPTATRALPNPAPDRIRVGKMNLKKLAQSADMVCYVNYIKGRPTLVYVMSKLDPATALKLNGGFAKDRKALVLADRDGVVKDSRFLNTPDKQAASDVMIPSALAAAKKLDAAGIGLALVTNQGGYEIGKMSFEETIAINVRVSQQLANAGGHLDAIFICPFSSALKDPPAGVVDARKPSSGMVLYAKELAKAKDIPVLGMVGDQRTDGAAGQGGGLKFYAVTDANGRWGAEAADAQRKNETLPTLNTDPRAYEEHPSFAASVDVIIAGV